MSDVYTDARSEGRGRIFPCGAGGCHMWEIALDHLHPNLPTFIFGFAENKELAMKHSTAVTKALTQLARTNHEWVESL